MSDDFDFADHDLDALPASTIAQFEAAAVRATQRAGSDYGVDLDDVTLDEVNQDEVDRDEVLDDVVNLDVVNLDDVVNLQHVVNLDDPLRSRIHKLEHDRAREQRDAAALKARLQTKSGEADTLRRRHDAELRRHARQLADQQQVHGDELVKLRAEIERLRREKEQAATSHLFRQHDARDAGMAPRARKPMANRPKTAAASPAGTPRKTRGPLGDGFDDDHVAMASPSRTRERHKAATPSLAAKRKRSVVDNSPIPLQLSEPRSQERPPEPAADVDAALLDCFRADDGRFDLLHRLLAHMSANGTDRVLEALARHAFPSDPSKPLSSLFYDALAAKTFADVHALALDMLAAICQLWAQCLAEKHYAPVSLLLDALHFVLACERCETACEIKNRFVPLMIDSIDLVAIPLSKAAKVGPDAVQTLYASGHRDITAHIDVLACLDILHLIATSCVGISDAAAAALWASIPSDFTIMLLNKEHPIAQISLMLRILSTSALPSSLGPITSSASPDSQTTREDALIGRLTNIFTEPPSTTADPAAPHLPPSATATLALRLQVVHLLTTLSISPHGATRLAQNRICTGRLIKHLDRCLTSLYRSPLAPTQPVAIASVNATMRLIYHIVTQNPGFDVKGKLANTLGGQHAWLVCMSRLAFSEGLVLEWGVEEGTVDMALGLLDEGLSLEEGEAFGGVFSTGSVA